MTRVLSRHEAKKGKNFQGLKAMNQSPKQGLCAIRTKPLRPCGWDWWSSSLRLAERAASSPSSQGASRAFLALRQKLGAWEWPRPSDRAAVMPGSEDPTHRPNCCSLGWAGPQVGVEAPLHTQSPQRHPCDSEWLAQALQHFHNHPLWGQWSQSPWSDCSCTDSCVKVPTKQQLLKPARRRNHWQNMFCFNTGLTSLCWFWLCPPTCCWPKFITSTGAIVGWAPSCKAEPITYGLKNSMAQHVGLTALAQCAEVWLTAFVPLHSLTASQNGSKRTQLKSVCDSECEFATPKKIQ